jgi:hypothetical protein
MGRSAALVPSSIPAAKAELILDKRALIDKRSLFDASFFIPFAAPARHFKRAR